jgi:hypothetical protein
MLPEILIKTGPDEDYYVVWSWEDDRPHRWGSRRDLEGSVVRPADFDRAAADGSAFIGSEKPGPLPWSDVDGIPVGDLGAGIVREDLQSAVERLTEDPDADLADFMSWPQASNGEGNE